MAKAPKAQDEQKPAPTWDDDSETGNQGGEGFTQAPLSDDDPDSDAAREELEADEAARRAELPNMQTTREFEEGRDAVSGTQNPGVVRDSHGHSSQGEAGNSDMSGKAALPDPLKALDPAHVKDIHDKLVQADRDDVNAFRAQKDMDEDRVEQQRVAHRRSSGWRTLADLGVHRVTLDALVKAGKVEVGHAPGMNHHGDTGVKYRIKKDRG